MYQGRNGIPIFVFRRFFLPKFWNHFRYTPVCRCRPFYSLLLSYYANCFVSEFTKKRQKYKQQSNYVYLYRNFRFAHIAFLCLKNKNCKELTAKYYLIRKIVSQKMRNAREMRKMALALEYFCSSFLASFLTSRIRNREGAVLQKRRKKGHKARICTNTFIHTCTRMQETN